MPTEDNKLVILEILSDDERAAKELAEKAGISVADLVLLALRYCLRAKGGEPFRELLTKGGVPPPRGPDLVEVESDDPKKDPA
jgi:hypothetical protein